MTNSSRRPLTTGDYTALRDAAVTHRAALIIRLAGEVGLTTSEIPTICPADIERVQATPPQFVLHVNGRTAYLPTSLRREIERYANSEDIDEDQSLIDISSRRVQMILDETADRAAKQTGKRSLSAVTGQTLRQYFAYSALFDEQIPFRVLCSVGGWEINGPLSEYLPSVDTEEIVSAFANNETIAAAASEGTKTLTHAMQQVIDTTSNSKLTEKVCETIAEKEAYIGAYFARWGPKYSSIHVQSADGIGLQDARRSASSIDENIREAILKSSSVHLATPVSQIADQITTDQVIFVPVHLNERPSGVMAVFPVEGRTIPSHEQDQLALLGQQIARTISDNRRQALIESDAVTELEFACQSPNAPLIQLSRELTCPVELESLIRVDDAEFICFVSIECADPSVVVRSTEDLPNIQEYRLIERGTESVSFELTITGTSPISVLLDAGGNIDSVSIDDNTAQLVVHYPEGTDVRSITNDLRSHFPETELAGKRTRERPSSITQPVDRSINSELDERQQDVLQAAFFGGYFDWPRGSTAEEIADSLDISSPTFHKHLRQGLHRLLSVALDSENTN